MESNVKRKPRVIPVLLLTEGGLVKTVKFTDRTYVGDPINAVKIFNDSEVDELIVLDIEASSKSREPRFDLIESLTSECFMPLCYGGGVRTKDQAERIFQLGVEKIALNSALFENPQVATEIAKIYGSQSVVASLDFKKNLWGAKSVYAHHQRKSGMAKLLEFVKKIEDLGVGEILLNSVDLDGTMQGYDLDVISEISAATRLPVIACGGAGSLQHVKSVIDAGASAAAAGSLFVFRGRFRAVLINYPSQVELGELFG